MELVSSTSTGVLLQTILNCLCFQENSKYYSGYQIKPKFVMLAVSMYSYIQNAGSET
jgi:hypothetical protein